MGLVTSSEGTGASLAFRRNEFDDLGADDDGFGERASNEVGEGCEVDSGAFACERARARCMDTGELIIGLSRVGEGVDPREEGVRERERRDTEGRLAVGGRLPWGG